MEKVILYSEYNTEAECDSELSPLFHDLELQYEEICRSSYFYDDNFDLSDADEEALYDKYKMVITPFHNKLFALEDIKKDVPASDNGITCRNYLDPNRYELMFFVDPNDPKKWYGFAALSVSTNRSDDACFYGVSFDLIYVRPEYRGDERGQIMSFAAGRLISGVIEHSSDAEEVYKDVKIINVDVVGQGANKGGKQCLRRFFDGISFGVFYTSYLIGDEYIEIPISTVLTDDN